MTVSPEVEQAASLLLEEVRIRIASLAQAKKRYSAQLAPDFYLLDFLRRDENGLSRYFALLLDPQGVHGQGALFLKAFIGCLGEAASWALAAEHCQVVTEQQANGQRRISIGRDWVLKTCLMLTGADVRFRVKNFDSDQVSIIQQQWPEIRACVVATFKLLRKFGLNDQSLRAKNAVIPLAFYMYKQSFRDKPLYHTINNINYLRDERLALSRWLHMVLLRGIFGGQADGVLTKMQRLLARHLDKGLFPLDEIIEAFTATNKDLRFDEAYLRGLLDIQYEDSRCRSVLSLLFPEINENLQLDIDHLHPSSAFAKAALAKKDFLQKDPGLMAFYQSSINWNSIANLHLLNASQNRSKKDLSLADWMTEKDTGFKPIDLLLNDDDSLHFAHFQTFCEKRREALMQRLRRNVVVSGTFSMIEEVLDEDEEIEAVA